MLQTKKDDVLQTARQQVEKVRAQLLVATGTKETKTEHLNSSVKTLRGSDAIIERTLLAHHQEQLGNLKQLYPSPYFAFCDFEHNGERKSLYFGKFSFRDANIYSWITPVAALRFEPVGPATYTRPDGTVQSGVTHRKDNYLIADGQIRFFATEELGHARELVYQEHFTRHKAGFILPEVVEQMERAQDNVVRLSYAGPLVISGPAGSGKTTLALHRVAYLLQSPETAEFFPPESVLVLVQDTGTKAYFSSLLPSLGITNVAIQTFSEWALAALQLTDCTTEHHAYGDEATTIAYEFSKVSALRTTPPISEATKPFLMLEKIYQPFFTPAQQQIWRAQVSARILDRFDLTLLLNIRRNAGELTQEKEFYEALKNGQYRKKTGRFPVHYNLLVVDEFQNYLPEQLAIFKSVLNRRTDAVVYVGDLAQQTRLGTIRDWSAINETILPERLIKLQKVYRNTKQILTYIRTRGYEVTIPEGIKEGEPVIEHRVETVEEQLALLTQLVPTDPNQTLGIISPTANYLQPFKARFADDSHVRCLTFYEAQGVEFDTVAIVGWNETFFSTEHVVAGAREEVGRMQRDLLYVALTRAMNKLVVIHCRQ